MRVLLTAIAFVLVCYTVRAQTTVVASIPITVERNKTIVPVSVGMSDSLRLILKPAVTKKKYLGRGSGGDIYGEEGRLSKVSMGEFQMHNVVSSIAPPEIRSKQKDAGAVVGNNILRRFNVVFDYARMKLHLKPNSRFHEPF